MLGDKMLIGSYEFSVDTHHRLFLPAQSNREHHDRAILMFDDDLEEYVIYSERAIEKKINKLEDLMLKANNDDDRKKYKLLLLNFCKGILRDCHVDSNGRIVVGDYFQPGEVINIIGVNDHYVLERKKKQ